MEFRTKAFAAAVGVLVWSLAVIVQTAQQPATAGTRQFVIQIDRIGPATAGPHTPRVFIDISKVSYRVQD
jgi:hypothetical protein